MHKGCLWEQVNKPERKLNLFKISASYVPCFRFPSWPFCISVRYAQVSSHQGVTWKWINGMMSSSLYKTAWLSLEPIKLPVYSTMSHRQAAACKLLLQAQLALCFLRLPNLAMKDFRFTLKVELNHTYKSFWYCSWSDWEWIRGAMTKVHLIRSHDQG